jgi:hypothetical protein
VIEETDAFNKIRLCDPLVALGVKVEAHEELTHLRQALLSVVPQCDLHAATLASVLTVKKSCFGSHGLGDCRG